MAGENDWKAEAQTYYRAASIEVDRLGRSERPDAESWIRDFRETMLGLKHAVIANDESLAARQKMALDILTAELRLADDGSA